MKVLGPGVYILIICLGCSQGNPRLKIPEESLGQRWKREGFFTDIDDPLSTMRRSFQGLTSNIGRSMHNIMSSISNGMRSLQAGFSNRNPKYIPYPSTPPEYPQKPAVHTPHFEYSQPEPAYTAPESVYTPAEPVYSQPVIVPFTPIDDNSLVIYNDDLPSYSPEQPSYIVDQPIYTDPLPSYNEAEEYGAPVKPVLDLASYTEEEYGAPIKPVLDAAEYNKEQEQYGAPIKPVLDLAGYTEEKEQYGAPIQPVITEYTPVQPVNTPVHSSTTHVQQPVQSSTTHVQDPVYDPEYHTREEICAHLQSLKEDYHSFPVQHPGGSTGIDLHKFEQIGVHVDVNKSSAPVPDQSHPEKYISVDCDHVLQVVDNNLWRKDLKGYWNNLKSVNKVYESWKHHSA